MPMEVSPASYRPGVSLARGSLASEPLMPDGRAGAGSGIKGLSFSSSSSAADWSAGGVAGFCSWACRRLTPKSKSSAARRDEGQNWAFGSSFLLGGFLLQHRLHNLDLGALGVVRIGGEIEQGQRPGLRRRCRTNLSPWSARLRGAESYRLEKGDRIRRRWHCAVLPFAEV